MNPLAKFIPSRDRLIEMVRQNAAAAKASLAESPATSWAPTLMVFGRAFDDGPDAQEKPELIVLAIPFNEHEEKHAALEKIGRSFYERKIFPAAVCLTSEVWRSTRTDCEPRNDPDREEGLMIVATTADKSATIMGFIPVIRLRGNMTLGDIDIPEPQKAGAPILSAFFRGFMKASPLFAQRN